MVFRSIRYWVCWQVDMPIMLSRSSLRVTPLVRPFRRFDVRRFDVFIQLKHITQTTPTQLKNDTQTIKISKLKHITQTMTIPTQLKYITQRTQTQLKHITQTTPTAKLNNASLKQQHQQYQHEQITNPHATLEPCSE